MIASTVRRLATIALVVSAAAGSAVAQWKLPVVHPGKPAPRWEKVLRNQVHYLLPTVSKGGTSKQAAERIREMSATAASAAICVRFSACENPADVQRQAIDILRTVAMTHNAGKAAAGLAWGRDWMSAFYAWQAAIAGWFLWDDLPADVRVSLTAMVIDEADRFLDLPAPYSAVVDTKGEENAWNSLILVFASEVLPAQAHTDQWRARAIEYIVSAFATPADLASEKLVNGRPLKHWLRGANVQSDFTIENHGIVHPDYYVIGPEMSLPSAIVYRLLGKTAPEALSHNVLEVYRTLKRFCLPGGDLLYPNGTDRTSHRLEMTSTLHVFMQRLFQDPDAGALAEDALATLEKMQARNPDGRTFVPGEFDHQRPAEGHAGLLYALALVLTKTWDLPPATKPLSQVWRDLEGAMIFESGRFFIARTPQSVISFAWGSQIMGLTLPFRKERLVNPLPLSYVGLAGDLGGTVRSPGRTGIGSAELAAAIQRESVTLQTVTTGSESGATFVTLHASHAGRSHSLAFTALPDGNSVYMERWTSVTATDRVLGGLISVLEEPEWVYGAPRRRMQGDGATWLNVDDQLGFAVSGGGIRTFPDVRSQLVALNTSFGRDAIIVTLPGATAAATKDFAAKPFGLKVDTRDVVATVVDGFLIASNLGASPVVAVAEYRGRKIRLAINGYSTRVLTGYSR